jgi:hypothetical protein
MLSSNALAYSFGMLAVKTIEIVAKTARHWFVNAIP